MLTWITISLYTIIDPIVSMANMNATQEIATIIASIADERATFDETYVLGLYTAAEMDAYLAWVESV